MQTQKFERELSKKIPKNYRDFYKTYKTKFVTSIFSQATAGSKFCRRYVVLEKTQKKVRNFRLEHLHFLRKEPRRRIERQNAQLILSKLLKPKKGPCFAKNSAPQAKN